MAEKINEVNWEGNPAEYQKADEKKSANYYYNLFQRAYGFASQRFDAYKELAAFYELTQDELPEYNIEKPWVYNINAPYATDAINLRVASLQANDYLGELEPLSPEDAETIMKLNWAYHSMWNEMSMDKHVNDAILRSAVVREAYTHVIFDDKPYGGTGYAREGILKPYFLDPSNVFIDPKAQNMKEADFIVISERVTPQFVRSNYKNYTFKDEDKSTGFSPSERGEIYAGTDNTTEQDFILTKITIYEREGEEVYKTVLVEKQIVVDTEKLPINVFPISQLRWQKRLKTPYGTSLMDMLLPLQKTINEIESAIANAALQFSSPSFVLSGDSGINPEDVALTAGTPGAVYVTDPGFPANEAISELFGSRKVDENLIEVKREIERTIYKLAGVSDQFLGDLGTVGNTRTGTDMAIQRAKIIENRFLTNLEEYVGDLTEIIVAFITEAFGGETLYVKKDQMSSGNPQFEQVDIPEDAGDIQYTFYVRLDVKTKYSKEQQRQLMRELYEIQTQFDAPVKGINFIDILKTYDVPNIQELVERLAHMTNMDAEQRAELIVQLVNAGAQYGIPEEILMQAITEIVLALKETPVVDILMQQIEQIAQEEEQAQQMAQGAVMQNQMEQPEMTGDEEIQLDTQE